MAIKKGDRLRYVGDYAPEVVASGNEYPPGTVVAFRNNRFHGRSVTVRLDGPDDLYADWPISMVEPVRTPVQSQGESDAE